MVGKGEREGKKGKKKKKKASRLPHDSKNMSYFPTCHSTRVPDLVRPHIPQRFHTQMGIRGKKKTPPTKNHGDPASPAHIRGMQGANETGSSHSAEGFLKATHIPNTHAPYCIYFQTNLAVNS